MELSESQLRRDCRNERLIMAQWGAGWGHRHPLVANQKRVVVFFPFPLFLYKLQVNVIRRELTLEIIIMIIHFRFWDFLILRSELRLWLSLIFCQECLHKAPIIQKMFYMIDNLMRVGKY